jgi:hypothetical protein
MNFGPLEFAEYLRRDAQRGESAAVNAARATQPPDHEPVNLLRVVSGPRTLRPRARAGQLEPVSVHEAVASNHTRGGRMRNVVQVLVRKADRPLVLVLSSHQSVEWHLSRAPGALVLAVLLSGFGSSTVLGVDPGTVHRIGGYYAFRRGSAAYRHLESEVLRCAGRTIEDFRSAYAESSIEI